jgi:hypothetical protein
VLTRLRRAVSTVEAALTSSSNLGFGFFTGKRVERYSCWTDCGDGAGPA